MTTAVPSISPLMEVVDALREGLAQPRHVSELIVIALAFVLAPLSLRLLRRSSGAGDAARDADDPARQLAFPLMVIGFLAMGEVVLRYRGVLAGPAEAHVLRLAMALTTAWMGLRVLGAVSRRLGRSSTRIAVSEKAVRTVVLVAVTLYATGLWDDVVQWMVSTAIPLGNSGRISIWSVLIGSLTTLLALGGAMWLGSFIDARLAAQSGLEPNLRIVLSRVLRALLLVAALLIGLALSGIDLTVLSVFGGALGVGLGLGLQRVASNYVSGFTLLIDHSLRIGDVISVDRYEGRVTQISTRYTVLRSRDGIDAVVPNEMLISSPVTNYTRGDRKICLSVDLPFAPHSDPAQLKPAMVSATLGVARVLAAPAPDVLFKDVVAGNLLLEVQFWIDDPENGRQNVRSDVALAVLSALRGEGVLPQAPRTQSA